MSYLRKCEEVEVQPTGIIECPDCSLKTDLIFVSSDGVKFAAHAKNLERYSEGFPPATFNPVETDLQVVHLEEESSTVRLLLQYMHLKPQPDIEKISFTELEELANAVEKYLIFSAMMVCKLCMKDQWMAALPWIYTRDIHVPTLHRGGLQECDLWEPFRDKVRRDVDCLPSQIARFEELVAGRIKADLGSCDRCIERARRWGTSVKSKIGEVSPFSAYL
ncbi:hypothetical protein C0995_003832 [Termitomyces sp. Mi166|nr:hypothetical protein C0995_003832 [Termitomyces sp. Mi166\